MSLSACNVQRKGCFDATQSDDPVQSNDPDAAFAASSFDHKDSREATCLLCLRPAVSPLRMGLFRDLCLLVLLCLLLFVL